MAAGAASGEAGRRLFSDIVLPVKAAGVDLETFCRVAEDLNKRKVIGRFSTFLEHVKPSAGGVRVTRFNALTRMKKSSLRGRRLGAGTFKTKRKPT